MPPTPRLAPASMPLAELLRFVPFFTALPGESAACFALLRQGAVEEREAGASLTVAGARPDLVFLVSGAAASHGRALGPGDHWGEIDLLLDRPAAADVRATARSLVYRLPGALFVAMVDHCDLLVRQMLRTLAGRLARATPC